MEKEQSGLRGRVLAELLPGFLHELGNRMTAIRLNIDAMGWDGVPATAVAGGLDRLSAEVDRATRSIALLQNLVAPRDEVTIARGDELVRRVTALLDPLLRKSQLAFDVRCDEQAVVTTSLSRLVLLLTGAIVLGPLPGPGGVIRIRLSAPSAAVGHAAIDVVFVGEATSGRSEPDPDAALLPLLAAECGAVYSPTLPPGPAGFTLALGPGAGGSRR